MLFDCGPFRRSSTTLWCSLSRQQSFLSHSREVLQRDVDRERRLRLDSECRLRNSASEAERCRARLATLQREFSRLCSRIDQRPMLPC
ncbi:NCK-associated protein 5 [Homalodisca vitripennis]|nr:NCK-associated protein 5 [Homalodisca vitripennis]